MKSINAKHVDMATSRMQGLALVVMLAVTLAMAPADATQVEGTEDALDVPVTTIQTRPDLGISKDVVVKRAGSAIAISGAVHVDPPRRTEIVSMKPARIRIELLDAEGKVRADKSLLLGSHGLHSHDGQIPTFDTHLEVEPKRGDRLRMYIEDEHK